MAGIVDSLGEKEKNKIAIKRLYIKTLLQI